MYRCMYGRTGTRKHNASTHDCHLHRGIIIGAFQLVHHFGPIQNISTVFGRITMTLDTYIHGPQRINQNESGDPLTFTLLIQQVVSVWWLFYWCHYQHVRQCYLWVKTPQHLIQWLQFCSYKKNRHFTILVCILMCEVLKSSNSHTHGNCL